MDVPVEMENVDGVVWWLAPNERTPKSRVALPSSPPPPPLASPVNGESAVRGRSILVGEGKLISILQTEPGRSCGSSSQQDEGFKEFFSYY